MIRNDLSETKIQGQVILERGLEKPGKKMRRAILAHRIFHPFQETQSSSVTRCVT